MTANLSIRLGALFAALAVLAGAFAAHGLKEVLDSQALGIFRTAAQYQFYHALALILTGIISNQSKRSPALPRLVFRGWDPAVQRQSLLARADFDSLDWRHYTAGWPQLCDWLADSVLAESLKALPCSCDIKHWTISSISLIWSGLSWYQESLYSAFNLETSVGREKDA